MSQDTVPVRNVLEVFYKPRQHQPGLQMAGRHIPVASTPFKWPCCHADRAYSHVQSIILWPWFENLLRDPPNIFLRGGQLIDDEYINRLDLGDFCPRQQGGKSIASARYPPQQPAAKSATRSQNQQPGRKIGNPAAKSATRLQNRQPGCKIGNPVAKSATRPQNRQPGRKIKAAIAGRHKYS
jgi:hypothetical protein